MRSGGGKQTVWLKEGRAEEETDPGLAGGEEAETTVSARSGEVEPFAFGIRRRSTHSCVMQIFPRRLFLMQTCVTTHTHTHGVLRRGQSIR